jgi:hypothetical protein
MNVPGDDFMVKTMQNKKDWIIWQNLRDCWLKGKKR